MYLVLFGKKLKGDYFRESHPNISYNLAFAGE